MAFPDIAMHVGIACHGLDADQPAVLRRQASKLAHLAHAAALAQRHEVVNPVKDGPRQKGFFGIHYENSRWRSVLRAQRQHRVARFAVAVVPGRARQALVVATVEDVVQVQGRRPLAVELVTRHQVHQRIAALRRLQRLAARATAGIVAAAFPPHPAAHRQGA
ncbi:hypothetical protein G6F59_014776 [Rhizopus arrhizus]|nr:hypothetical protein G6F59_014776 [Rhizopus arrhizus]